MTDSHETQQLTLFPQTPSGEAAKPPSPAADLTAHTPLNVALGAFEKYMQARGFTENTQQAFRLDMQILSDYLGPVQAIGDISPVTLNAFVKWLNTSRGVPCSPKTLERRITTLKVFFGWLAEEGVVPRDAAAPLIHQSVTAPLPEILTGVQIDAALAVTHALRAGSETRKPDTRPHILFTLILHTGIKKSECVNLHINHIDLTDVQHPALWVRYKEARRRYKERRIALPQWWPAVLREYLEQYPSRQHLFPWSARNLEYVLTDLAAQAEIPRITFEMLRWTCAARDFAADMDRTELRHKLGLSEVSWYEVEVKLALLAQRIKIQ
ncbi:MAG: tyrosine-type recombinase/integrase [Anaerolineae bacterium]